MSPGAVAGGVIEDNYTPALSNFLREPMLVQALISEIETLKAETRAAPRVKKLEEGLKQLHGIVNIPLDGVISEADVKRMNELTGYLAEDFLL